MARNKKLPVVIAALFAIVLIIFNLSNVSAQDTINIYRLYNSSNGEHLYTSDQSEVLALVQAGWNDEGTGWVAPASGSPVYRLFSPALSDHLYTSDINEISLLISLHGWVADFDGQPIFYSGGTIPVYRLYNASNGHHHLTTDEFEYNVLGELGWQKEGVAMNALELGVPAQPQPSPDPQPDQPDINPQPQPEPEQGITLTIQKEDGSSYGEGFTCRIYKYNGNHSPEDALEAGSGVTDANGQLSLGQMEPGDYFVSVDTPDGYFEGDFTVTAEDSGNKDIIVRSLY